MMRRARLRIALLWGVGAVILLALMLWNVAAGTYGEQSGKAWDYLVQYLSPSLGLVFSVAVFTAPADEGPADSATLALAALAASGIYLAALALPFFQAPDPEGDPLPFFAEVARALTLFQPVVAAILGVFFAKASTAKPAKPA